MPLRTWYKNDCAGLDPPSHSYFALKKSYKTMKENVVAKIEAGKQGISRLFIDIDGIGNAFEKWLGCRR
jgi:hypothetical protein